MARWMVLVFGLTLFASATLLFLVQPLVGKMLLPLLGGSPAVWNTCMAFFQVLLLAGYSYAHFATRWLGPRRQAVVHLAVLCVPLLFLPLAVDRAMVPQAGQSPVLGLTLLLTVAVGMPFFVVSATAPLLQRWFADTDHPAAHDPYFLYAASNLGSMAALLGYPLVVEPFLRLSHQSVAWSVGYAVLLVLTATCAVLLWKSPRPGAVKANTGASLAEEVRLGRRRRRRDRRPDPKPSVQPTFEPAPAATGQVTAARRARWVVLAAVPSSLMLDATTYMTTDVAAVPMLWALPLAVYLLSFILVFSRAGEPFRRALPIAVPLLVLALVLLMFLSIKPGIGPSIALVLSAFFAAAMVCHGQLAADRPDCVPHQ